MRYYLILWTFLLSSGIVYSQNCAIGSLAVPYNDSAFYSLEVFDIINEDLTDPNQGVCSIEMSFMHNKVNDFEVWLVSPAGDTVALIGPNASTGPFTLGGSWKITFVNDAEFLANPDSSFSPRFDNIVNEFGARSYSGTYYPYQGSLADFNRGSVNGTWQLILRTFPTNIEFPSSLTHFKINFCDPRGDNCCFADAGTLNVAGPVEACEGDPALNFPVAPTYAGDPPDSMLYGYTYAIAQDSVLLLFDSIPDFTGFAPGNYQLCGLSYQLDQVDSIPVPDGVFRLDSLRDNLNRAAPLFCGELSPTCIDIFIRPVPDTVRIDTVACAGNSVQVGDSTYSTPGRYITRLQSPLGCDSVVVLDLQFFQSDTTRLDTLICAGESVRIGNRVFRQAGSFVHALRSAGGCDSIVVLNLGVAPVFRDTIIQTVCSGQGVEVGGTTFDSTGFYEITFTSSETGCDSIIVLDLTVLAPQVVEPVPDTLTCIQTEITLDGTNSVAQPPGQLSYRWENSVGMPIGFDSRLRVSTPGTYFLQISQVKDGVICATRTNQIEVISTVEQPVIDIGPGNSLNCLQTTVMIGGTGSADGPAILYNWTTPDGSIIQDADQKQAIVDAPGTYVLQVLDTNTGCSIVDSVAIAIDTLRPVVTGLKDSILSCGSTGFSMPFTITPSTRSYDLQWNSLNGNQPRAAGTLQPVFQVADTYQLMVTDNITGCTRVETITIDQDTTAPVVQIAPPDFLNCERPQILLDASNSSQDPKLRLEWLALDGGRILSGADTYQPLIEGPGRYQLTLVDTTNSCQSSATVAVQDTVTVVTAVINTAVTVLTCDRPSLTLGVTGSTVHPDVVYQWTAPDGTVITSPGGDSLQISQAGTYQLVALDTFSRCADTTGMVITQDTVTPQIQLNVSGELSCGAPLVQVDASGSTLGPDVVIDWQGPCITSGTGSLQIEVDCPGTYYLEIRDTLNGCSSLDSILVNQNPSTPNAVLAADTVLINCITGTAVLDGTGSSGGTISWISGGIVLGTDIQLTVDSPGLYTLRVENTALGCTDERQVLVERDCRPSISLAPVDTINCTLPNVRLDASASQGVNLAYRWTAPAPACLLDSSDSPAVVATCPGIYQLVLSDTLSGETDTIIIEVFEDVQIPIAEAGNSDTLNCNQTSVSLDASTGSTLDGATSLIWFNDQGDSLSNQPNLTVNVPGQYILEVINNRNGCTATDSVEVFQATNLPEVSFGADEIPCDQDSFAIEFTLEPASNNLLISWQGPGILDATDPFAVWINTPGSYQVTLTDTITACSLERTVVISKASCAPCVTLEVPDTLSCLNPVVALSATLCSSCFNCTFNWSTADGRILSGTNTLNPTVDQAGIYQLEITDTAGVSITSEIEVVGLSSGLAGLNAIEDQLLTCVDTVITLDPGILNTAGLQTSWVGENTTGTIFFNATTPTVQVRTPGRYRFVVRDTAGGCTDSLTVMVEQDVRFPAIDAGMDTTLDCSVSQLLLTGTVLDPSGGHEFFWTGPGILSGQNSLNPEVGEGGTYRLSVRDTSNGCVATDAVEVIDLRDPPQIILNDSGPYELNCSLRQIELDASGSLGGAADLSFRWTNTQNQLLSDQPTVIIQESGSYTLVVSNQNNGCTNSTLIEVTEGAGVPDIELETDGLLDCNTSSVKVSAKVSSGGPLAYEWTNASGALLGTTSVIEVTEGGTVTLMLTDEQTGCTVRRSITVEQAGEPANVTIEVQAPVCGPGTPLGGFSVEDVSGGTAPYLYAIGEQPFSTNAIFSGLLPGEYRVRIQDAGGCQLERQVIIPAPASLVADLGADRTIQLGDSIGLNVTIGGADILAIEWRSNNAVVANSNTFFRAQPEITTLYEVFVTDRNGCSARDQVTVFVEKPPVSYAPTAFSPNEDGINDRFLLNTISGIQRIVQFNIFDRWGNLLFTRKDGVPNSQDSGWDGTFNGALMPAGVYIFWAELERSNGKREIVQGDFLLIR